jgi:hypothetical protein
MADKDYKFTVLADNLEPYGPVGKENLDVIRLVFDFSCWVDTNENLGQIDFPTISLLPPSSASANWRQDYPPDDTTTDSAPPDDTYPLKVVSEAITGTPGTTVEIKVNAGTPDLSYVVSFVVVGSSTRRRKQVDTIVNIEHPVNPLMVGPGDLDPDVVPPIIITGTTALPMGFDGWVFLSNTGNTDSIVITMPPNPILGQMLGFIDTLGKDEAHPVTFRGDGDVPIDGDGSLAFVSSISFDVLRFSWGGANWHVESMRYGFLG